MLKNSSLKMSDSPNATCRCCLKTGQFENILYVYYKTKQLSDLLHAYTTVQVIENDTLPKGICNDCTLQLINIHEFKTKCMETDEKLHKQETNELKEMNIQLTLEEPNDDNKVFAECLQIEPKLKIETERSLETIKINETVKDAEENSSSINKENNLNISLDSSTGNLVRDPNVNSQNSNENDKCCPTKNGSFIKVRSNKFLLSDDRDIKGDTCGTTTVNNVDPLRSDTTNSSSITENILPSFIADHYYTKKIRFHPTNPSLKQNLSGKGIKKGPPEKNIFIRGGGIYKCFICCKSFYRYPDFLFHKQQNNCTDAIKAKKTKVGHVSFINIICDICKLRFKNMKGLRYHQKHCNKNEKTAATPSGDLHNTEAKKTKSPPETVLVKRPRGRPPLKFICDICKLKFKNSKDLQYHKIQHNMKIKKMETSKNLQEKTSTEDLTFHKEQHDNEVKNVEENLFTKIRNHYKCKVCSRPLATKGSLHTHLLTHTGKSHLCKVCGKKYVSKDGLQIHSRVHTGEHPYSCTFCERTFAFRKSWQCHEMIHRNLKPHDCPHCEKSFRQKAHLTYHLRSHSGEKPYSCLDCGKSFSYSGSLKNHMIMHIEDEDT